VSGRGLHAPLRSILNLETSDGAGGERTEAMETLSRHFAAVEASMTLLRHFSRDYPYNGEDELTIHLLGIRLFNSAAGAVQSLTSGFICPSFFKAGL
jgi:hypothetical protein